MTVIHYTNKLWKNYNKFNDTNKIRKYRRFQIINKAFNCILYLQPLYINDLE